MRVGLAVLAAALFASTTAHADDKAACVAAYEAAQTARLDKKLREAHAALEVCAQPTCPKVLVSDCTRWKKEVDALVASVSIVVEDPAGAALSDVKLTIDRELVPAKTVVEPGSHLLRAERGDDVVEGTFEARAAEQVTWTLRLVHKPAPNAPPSAPPNASSPTPPPPIAPTLTPTPALDASDLEVTRPIPIPSIVFASVGLASLGAFTAFGLVGLHQRNDLGRERLQADLLRDRDPRIQRDFLAADVFLGAAVVSLAIATT